MNFDCETCGTTKQGHFSSSRSARCRDCERCAQFRSKYGISREQVEALHHEQDGRCAICHDPVHLVVDHDHVTGTVRGLICHACNKGLGLFRDSQYLFERAALYLRDNS